VHTPCRLKETSPLYEADELHALERPPSMAETVAIAAATCAAAAAGTCVAVIFCTELLDAPFPSVGRHPTFFAIIVQHAHAGQRHVRAPTPADGAPTGAHHGAAATGQLAKLLLHVDDRAAAPTVLFTEVHAHALVAMEDGRVLG